MTKGRGRPSDVREIASEPRHFAATLGFRLIRFLVFPTDHRPPTTDHRPLPLPCPSNSTARTVICWRATTSNSARRALSVVQHVVHVSEDDARRTAERSGPARQSAADASAAPEPEPILVPEPRVLQILCRADISSTAGRDARDRRHLPDVPHEIHPHRGAERYLFGNKHRYELKKGGPGPVLARLADIAAAIVVTAIVVMGST